MATVSAKDQAPMFRKQQRPHVSKKHLTLSTRDLPKKFIGDREREVKSPKMSGGGGWTFWISSQVSLTLTPFPQRFYRKSLIWRSKVQVFEGQLSEWVPPRLTLGTFLPPPPSIPVSEFSTTDRGALKQDFWSMRDHITYFAAGRSWRRARKTKAMVKPVAAGNTLPWACVTLNEAKAPCGPINPSEIYSPKGL